MKRLMQVLALTLGLMLSGFGLAQGTATTGSAAASAPSAQSPADTKAKEKKAKKDKKQKEKKEKSAKSSDEGPTPAAPKAQSGARASASADADVRSAKGAQRAPAVGGGAGKVWVNTDSNIYHCPGTRFYGKTKQGEYMSESAAKARGARPDHNKACS